MSSLASVPDQSWLVGASTAYARDGAAAFTDLAIARANVYPADYPDSKAGAGGQFFIQFTTHNLVAMAGTLSLLYLARLFKNMFGEQ